VQDVSQSLFIGALRSDGYCSTVLPSGQRDAEASSSSEVCGSSSLRGSPAVAADPAVSAPLTQAGDHAFLSQRSRVAEKLGKKTGLACVDPILAVERYKDQISDQKEVLRELMRVGNSCATPGQPAVSLQRAQERQAAIWLKSFWQKYGVNLEHKLVRGEKTTADSSARADSDPAADLDLDLDDDLKRRQDALSSAFIRGRKLGVKAETIVAAMVKSEGRRLVQESHSGTAAAVDEKALSRAIWADIRCGFLRRKSAAAKTGEADDLLSFLGSTPKRHDSDCGADEEGQTTTRDPHETAAAVTTGRGAQRILREVDAQLRVNAEEQRRKELSRGGKLHAKLLSRSPPIP